MQELARYICIYNEQIDIHLIFKGYKHVIYIILFSVYTGGIYIFLFLSFRHDWTSLHICLQDIPSSKGTTDVSINAEKKSVVFLDCVV